MMTNGGFMACSRAAISVTVWLPECAHPEGWGTATWPGQRQDVVQGALRRRQWTGDKTADTAARRLMGDHGFRDDDDDDEIER